MKKSKEDIPVTGMAVLQQQYTLAEAIEEWIASLKKEINSKKCMVGTKEMLLFFSLDCNEIVRSGCYTELTK